MRPILLLAALVAAPALAQPMPAPVDPCPLGTASAELVGGLVRARLFTNGNLFFGNGTEAGYVVPTPGTVSPIFAQGFLLAGKVEGEIRAAEGLYSDYSFRPGLIGTDRTAPTPDECAAADRIWVVDRADVAWYEQTREVRGDLGAWPVHLGAPVRDGDGVPGNYDLSAGDRPLLTGDVTAFWAMNDAAKQPWGPPDQRLGVDVTVEAFAFHMGQPALMTATFYRYRVTNRSGATIDSLFAGQYVDFDLGGCNDDYVGADTTLAMGFGYNSDDDDQENCNSTGSYGAAPPAIGVQILGSPAGTDGQPLGLTAFHYFIGGASYPQLDPASPTQFFHFLRGDWSNGEPMRECQDGYQCDGPVTTFVFPGDPVTGAFWSERNTGNGASTPGDRRVMLASGPITLAPDESATWLFAIPYGRGADHLDSVTRLRQSARLLEAAYAGGLFEPSASTPTEPEPPPFAIAPPAPNPFAGRTTIRLQGLPVALALTLTVRDVLGRVVAERPVPPGATAVEVGDGLAAGVYTVDLAAPGATTRFRIVKAQ